MTWVATISAIFFNTFVNPIALAAIAWKYYFVFVVVLIIYGLTAFFFYPETRGYSLEQIAVIFDGENAEVISPEETVARSFSKSDQAKGADIVSHEEKV